MSLASHGTVGVVKRRRILIGVAGGAVVTSLAVRPAPSQLDWARVAARTCQSTLARSGVETAPSAVDPAIFAAQRRLVAAAPGAPDSVTAFETACTSIRDRIVATTTSVPARQATS
jgi:hypothetical protein